MKHEFNASQIPNITWKTLDDLYKYGDSDCVAMFLKYCYHANIQGTNQIYARLSFMSGRDEKGKKIPGALGWGRDKTRRVRDQLISLGYIELLPQKKDEKTGFLGNVYTKINHLITQEKMETALLKTSIVDRPTGFTDSGKNQHKCLKDNKLKCLNNIEEEEDRNFSHSNASYHDATTADKANVLPALATIGELPATVKSIYDLSVKTFKNPETERLTTTTIIRTKKILALGYGLSDFATLFNKSYAWSDKTPRLLSMVVKNPQTFEALLNFQVREEANQVTELRSNNYIPDIERVSKWDKYKN